MFYKDLEVWKESIDLTILIYEITDNFPEKEKYGIINQETSKLYTNVILI